MGQLRILIPALATVATALGINATATGSYEQMAMASIAPIAYFITSIWSLVANSRHSIMLSASKPVEAGAPVPLITLPRQEKALADQLPLNVTAAK
jgi:hypothetical protein